MEGGVDKSQKNSSYEKNNAKDDIHKIDDNVKSSKVNKTSNVIIMQRNDLQCEKKTFCSDDVKKHVSLLCKCVSITPLRVHSSHFDISSMSIYSSYHNRQYIKWKKSVIMRKIVLSKL